MTQPQETGQEHSTTFTCYWHPEAETGLSCSRCGKHICPQCMVQAPVGIRCRECGRAAPMPTYDVRPTYYARALGTASGMAVGGGIVWALLIVLLGGVPFLPGLIGIGVGYAAGELISLSVNRKRSKGLAWLAGGSVVVAFLVSWSLLRSVVGPIGIGYLGGYFGLLFIILGVVLAVQKVRP